MRPRLKPVLRRIERDGRTLQFGVHPLRAVVLTGVEPPVRRLIDGLDGTRSLRQAVAGSGLDEASAQEVVARLAAHGLIEDAAARPEPLAGLPLAERDRLRPELDRLSLTSTDGGMSALSARRAARVRVYGAGRVAPGSSPCSPRPAWATSAWSIPARPPRATWSRAGSAGRRRG
ncbi:hypothetical protein [Microbispora sp. GKU 823]|uniref:hypothetical protein n=1 Tax=Microbispora sp. GKU 823 TaxID=1652100 RepID=UPI002118D594|nr:hypothetical protein [Microbispora sp. GKU 823]